MKFKETIINVLSFLTETIQNFLVPESNLVQGLIKIDPETMRLMLPNSKVRSEDIFVLFDYQNRAVKTLVKLVKYKNNKNIRERVARYFHEDMAEIFSDIALFEGIPPILIPMPMSKKEKQKRGFNQCEEIVKDIKKISGENFEVSFNALTKHKETERQTKLDREKRILNVKNSMKADSKVVENRIIAVLDDVYTTGSTMLESRRALYDAGAKRVINFFLAR